MLTVFYKASHATTEKIMRLCKPERQEWKGQLINKIALNQPWTNVKLTYNGEVKDISVFSIPIYVKKK